MVIETWTNSNRVKERTDEKSRRRRIVIHGHGIIWTDDKDAKIKEYKLGRAVERAMQKDLEGREHGENILLV